MYHFPHQEMYHHNPYQQCPINIEDIKLQNLNTISETQYHQVLPQNIGVNTQLQVETCVEQPQQVPPQTKVIASMKKKNTAIKKIKLQAPKSAECKNSAKKPSVDTSNFSIEERLVAAVWVHERKYTSSTISEIKHNFRRRFGRDPPSKTTLFAWERKLFSSGNVCDAPRTGRPINRKSHISEVAASVRAAPALSLRARARALRLPRSTLHNILRNDLPYSAAYQKPEKEQLSLSDMQPPKRRLKQPPTRKSQPHGTQLVSTLSAGAPLPLPPPPPPPPPPARYVTHAMNAHAHEHGYT